LFRASIIADGKGQIARLGSELASKGLLCSIDTDGTKTARKVSGRDLDLVFIAIDGKPDSLEMINLAHGIKQESHLPVIALLSKEALHKIDSSMLVDDFVVEPWDATEIVLRAKRILKKTESTAKQELIECGDLTIDLAKYEVYVNNRLIELTFKEYELLRFLASNKGRVFSREALLNEVWGYDYYGGDRTVDVHIRRLRSKIEDSTHTFIETVRNIGYKFKEPA
jgi:two-component system, OmpR family, alkaline phosphatase synthesis response regulator PhoP